MDEEVTIVYLNNEEKIIKYFSESKQVFNQRIDIIRLMEKDNTKIKNGFKNEYSRKIKNLISNLKKKDPRYLKYQKEEREAQLKKEVKNIY